MNRFVGLRGRIWLLVALATMPLFIYSFLGYLDHRAQVLVRAEQNLLLLIRSALAEEAHVVKHGQDLLRIAANSRSMAALDGPECSGFARGLLREQRDYLNFGAVLPDGTLFCSGLPWTGPASFADSPWFSEAMERKGLSEGYYMPSPVAGSPSIVFALPVLDGTGRVRAVAFASAGLGWLSNLASTKWLPPGWGAAAVGPEGEIIFRQASADRQSGRLAQTGELASLLRTHPSLGMYELVDSDGLPHLYGIAPLDAVGGRIHVVIDAPKSVVLAPVEKKFRQLLLLMVLSVASILVGQRAICHSFVRWARRLQENINRIGAGEREIRVQETSSIPELREIDAALGSMVDNINAGAAALRASQEHLGLALEGADLGAWDWQVTVGVTDFNPRLAQMLGYSRDEFQQDAELWKKSIYPDDRPVVDAAVERHFKGEAPIYECEYRIRHRDGRWLWILARGRVVEVGEDGKPVRMAGTVLDITNRKITEQQLRQRTEELVALVEAMPALVWIARDGKCREIVENRAASQLRSAQMDADAAESGIEGGGGLSAIRCFGPDGKMYSEDQMPLQRAASLGKPVQDAQIEAHLPDGRKVWLYGNAVPLFDDLGAVRGALGAFVDITHFKATEADVRRHRNQLENLVAERTYELAVAKEAAERANRTKSQFLANVSHDLRTPLNSLMLLAHVLADNSWDNLTPQQIEYARMIELSGNDLLQLIDELLDLARMETGQLDIQIEPVPFPDLMQDLRRTHHHVAEQKELDFKMEIDADVPATIVTDSRRLQQLLRNLISNAIKFTHQGSVTLRIRRAVSGWRYSNPALASAEVVIAFDVIDTGTGIDPAVQKDIFGGAKLADGSPAGEQGSGLGMAISREIACLLGGELGLASTPGQGSTFTIYLPLVYAGPTTMAANPTAADVLRGDVEPALAGKTVLVVASDQNKRRMFQATLEGAGVRVLEAASGAEALEKLSRNIAVDLVLIEVPMPGMDGYQTTQVIRQSLGCKSLPVVALVAEAAADAREAGLAAGCSDLLSEQALPGELLDCLRRWLEEREPAEA